MRKRMMRRGAAVLGAAAVLGVASLLAGCAAAPGAVEEPEGPSLAIDDSSDVLDATTEILYGNVDTLKFKALVRLGTVRDQVDAADIKLDGALSGWTVSSVRRASDTQLEVEAERPAGLANNGASVAYVGVSADAIDIPASDEDPETLQGPVGDMTPAPERAVAVDDEASSGEGETDATSAEGEATEPAYYALSIAFVDPYLTVDYDGSRLDGSKLTLSVEAHDYYFDEGVSEDDFRIDGTDLYTVDSVRRDSPEGLSIVLSLLEASERGADSMAALAGAVLVHEDNATGGEVPCPLAVVDPWVDVAFDYEDADSETVGLEMQLHNSDDELTGDDVTVSVDGAEVEGVAVEAKGEGAYSIVIPRGDLTPDSIVSVDVAPVEGALGRQSDPAPASEDMSALGDSTDRDFNVKEIIISNGKSGLSALAQMGWQQVCKLYIDPTLDTSLYNVTSNELLAEIVKMQQQDADVSAQIGALVDAADSGAGERTIDAVRSSIEKISSAERHVRGKIDEIQNTADPKERRRLLIELNIEYSVLKSIDVIARELPVLYDLLMNPGYSGTWGSNLIELYDNLLAKTYNWGVQTYPFRVSFRENLALVWAQAAQIVELAYGVTNTGEYTDELDRIDEMTRGIDELINVRSKIDVTSFYYYDGLEQDIASGPKKPESYWIEDFFHGGSPYDTRWDWLLNEESLAMLQLYREQMKAYEQTMSTFDQDLAARVATAILYCNTTGRWYRPLSATDADKGWSCAHQQKLSEQPGEERWVAESPFRSFTKSEDAYNGDFDWASRYMGTEEAKQMTARLHGDATLGQELADIGFAPARYLITSDRFETEPEEDVWKMDTFEVVDATSSEGAGFTADKAHFSGRYPAYTNWCTPLSDMFVLRVAAGPK